MLGLTRFILCALVIVNHVWQPAANMFGFHAVAAFYMTSGYLMTRIIQEVYGTNAEGIGRFLVNRALRILPAYYVFLALTLLLILLMPAGFGFGRLVAWPHTDHDWFANLTLIDLVWAETIVIPPAWSLGIELLFYVLMPLMLARTAAAVHVWFAVSLAITAALLINGLDFGYRYYPAYAASLFFSLGALCYVQRHRFAAIRLGVVGFAIMLVVFSVTPLVSEALGVSHLTWGFYAAAILFTVVLISADRSDGLPAGLDKWLGDLCYPMYLAHFLVAAFIAAVSNGSLAFGSTEFLIVTFAVTLFVAGTFVVVLDQPLQRLRARWRPASALPARPLGA
jgi:peptidoglycan/LPS O-acetylase OafA/YrhL